RPGDVSGSAHADAVGFVAVAEGGVVAGRRVGAVVAGHPVRAVEEVAELVDAEPDVCPHHAVVGRVRVRAGVAEASAPGADIGGLARVREEEADAVGSVTARPAGVTAVGHGLEGDRNTLAGGERIRGDDGAVLRVAARIAVGEAQRALTVRVGKSLGRTRDAVLASDQVRVVSALNDHASGYLAVAGPRALDPPSCCYCQA